MANKAKKLPSGAYRVVMRDPADPNHGFKSFTAPTAAEAELKAAQYKLTHNEKRAAPITFGEALTEYIDNRTSVLSPSTIALYRTIGKTAFPNLSKIKIGSITQQNIQRDVNAYAATHAPKTVHNAVALISVILNEYRPDFKYTLNVPQRKKPSIEIPTTDQITELLKKTKGTDMELPIMFGAFLGLRRSEICSLSWDNIDGDMITINSAVVYDDVGTLVKKTTKTTQSERTLQMPKQIVDALPAKGESIIKLTPKQITARFTRLVQSLGYTFTFHG